MLKQISSKRFAAVIALLMLGESNTYAADVQLSKFDNQGNGIEQRHQIRLNGPIESGDVGKLKSAFKQIEQRGGFTFRTVTLSLTSPGGDLDPAIELANFVRNAGLATHVGANEECLSACAIVFMAGTLLDGDDTRDRKRTMHHKAKIGFHAPFAFKGDENISEEAAALLLKSAELSGSISASKLLELSRSGILPTSLAEELLKYDEGSFLYINTIDRAGRWGIELDDAKPLKLNSGIVQKRDWERLNTHCNNFVHWKLDVSFHDRKFDHGLPENELVFDGLANGCSYKIAGKDVNFNVTTDNGNASGLVDLWQTFAADTQLAMLSLEQISGQTSKASIFENPPPRLTTGLCSGGYRWIGGWSGKTLGDSTPFAEYRSCSSAEVPLRMECLHGQGKIKTRIDLRTFNIHEIELVPLTSQVDGKRELTSGGKITMESGIPEHVSILNRNYFTFEDIKAGKRYVIKTKGREKVIHLKGSRKAIEAMENACL